MSRRADADPVRVFRNPSPRPLAAVCVMLVLVVLAPLAVAEPPLNDTPETATPVVVPIHRAEQDTREATRDVPDLAFGCAYLGYSDKSVWYRYVATTPLPVRMSTEGSDYDTVLDAFVQEADGTYTRVACDFTWLSHSEFVLEPSVGTVYYVQAGGYSPAWGWPSQGGDLVFTIETAL